MVREAVDKRLPRDRRLRKRAEFLDVQSGGAKVHSRHFVVVRRPREGTGCARLGITVSKRVGSAVTRNRIKRLVREFVRQREWLPAGFDVVVIAKRSAAGLPGLAALAQDLDGVFMGRVGC